MLLELVELCYLLLVLFVIDCSLLFADILLFLFLFGLWFG